MLRGTGSRGHVLAIRILLDTHTFLWVITDDRRLSRHARRILQTADLFLSVASLWEIVTRVQIGKLSLPAPPSKYLPRHLAELDALVVAQSLEEKPPLLSCDSLLEPYGADLRWE
jgi:PIN domain nuclease of toxin-antitoxin system